MKKLIKLVCGFLAFALIGATLFFANALLGNPVSQFIAKNNSQKYIAQEYPDMTLETEKPFYDFKRGSYVVKISSLYSIDTRFEVTFSHSGKMLQDTYDNYVSNKFNTWQRVDSQYSEQVEKALRAEDFQHKVVNIYGIIQTYDDYSDFELDKNYDINQLAEKSGKLVLHAESKNVNAKTAAEIILEVKNFFDKEGVSFYSIDFHLNLPVNADGTLSKNNATFDATDVLYSEIGGDDFEKRIEEIEKITKEKTDIANAQKQKEIDDFEKATKK